MKKAPNVIRPIRRLSSWCLRIWDGISGKDYRRAQRLRHDLAIAQERVATLTQQLTQAQTQCTTLQGTLNERQNTVNQLQNALDNSHQALDNSRQQYNQLLQDHNELQQDSEELGEWITESEDQVQSLRRELRNCTSALVNCEANVNAIQQSNWEALPAISTAPIPSEDPSPTTTLAHWKIAFVGGHQATRRVVIETLQTDYGLVHKPVEIPPHREHRSSQKQLKEKLADCDLIVSIVRYSNHSLTKSLMQLKKNKGALKGDVLVPDSRGVSGVVQAILAFVAKADTLNADEAE